ncbi:LOW QUALITY PROTEIN: hypothetical protein NC653_037785 [Populus alba x Populus x berolinensis]|uniref:Uncharacterized protein n=1 Tax=Populus alba x Populus x berolinensis TaxID=444605 RepID=A0AAD6LFC2_9ROSI|nr:LOW QUALITY PROTEIN: hypothetical protein NC653_037785 [Populus alba x Populus x berolinensis]
MLSDKGFYSRAKQEMSCLSSDWSGGLDNICTVCITVKGIGGFGTCGYWISSWRSVEPGNECGDMVHGEEHSYWSIPFLELCCGKALLFCVLGFCSMSRCFPFPPPGYEKKARSDDFDLLKKEDKEKKNKEKNRR